MRCSGGGTRLRCSGGGTRLRCSGGGTGVRCSGGGTRVRCSGRGRGEGVPGEDYTAHQLLGSCVLETSLVGLVQSIARGRDNVAS